MRNIFLIVFILVVLAAPCGSVALQKLSPSFATFVSTDQQKANYLAGSKDTQTPIKENLSLASFIKGDLQASIENKLDAKTPGRYYALLGYAASQRIFIETSNSLFNFDVYPARYSNDALYLPESNSLAGMPLQCTARLTEKLSWTAEKFANLARDYPDKHFCIIVADISNTSSIQPASRLNNNLLSTNETASLFEESCKEVPNVTVFSESYSDLSSYYNNHYTTDHHWNGWGALSAYKQAISKIEIEQQAETTSLEINDSWKKIENFEEIAENGSYSRSGLMLLNEPVNEPKIPLEKIEIVSNTSLNGKDAALPKLIEPNKTETAKYKLASEFNFYETWYGGSINTITTNEASNTHKSAIVIGDSYSSAFRWIAATRFDRVTSLQDFRGNAQRVTHVRETLDSNSADYVFFVAATQNYFKTADKFPNYFD